LADSRRTAILEARETGADPQPSVGSVGFVAADPRPLETNCLGGDSQWVNERCADKRFSIVNPQASNWQTILNLFFPEPNKHTESCVRS
jgi:hypothetical protein